MNSPFFFRVRKSLAVLSILLFAVAQISAAQTWNPSGGAPYYWNNPNNWSPVGVPTGASNVTIGGGFVCTLDISPTIASLTFSGNMDMNGKTLIISSANPSSISAGAITNSGTLSFTSTGNVTITGGTIAPSVTINGAAVTTISGGATLGGTVAVTSSDIKLNGATFNGATSTFTKTGASVSNWNGGNTFNGNATITVSAGTLNFPTTSTDTFNKDLTITRSSTINACASVNCKLGGNVVVNGSAGSFTFGSTEFIGALPQAISSGGSITLPLNFTNMVLNKSVVEKVMLNTKIASDNVTFTKGIISSQGTNDIIINTSWSGGNNTSYVEGRVRHAADTGFDFPTGDQGYFRPINALTFRTTSPPMAVTYHHATPPNNLSLSLGLIIISDCEYWEIRDALGGSISNGPDFVTINWEDFACHNYVNDPSNLRVARLPVVGGVYATTWVPVGGSGGTSSPPYTTGSIQAAFVDNNREFGLFALGSFIGTNLPIELSEFSGKPTRANDVLLTWITASETNNDHFEIERSSNGTDFTKIGKIDGHGTTSVEHKYSFLDSDPFVGLSYYRLRQVDFDGESTYSSIVSVSNFKSDRSVISFFPNPAADKLFASHKTDVTMVDVLGNVVYSAKDVNEISLERLNPGVYCLMATSGEVFRFVKN